MVVARPKTIRAINAELVAGLLLDGGWTSRATLARRTGLSKPSVAEVVDQLVEAKVLLKRDTGARTREYATDARRVLGAAVSLSVESLEVRVVDAKGTVLGSTRMPHDQAASPGHIGRSIDAVLSEAGLSPEALESVVIAVAASFDERSRQLRHADSLPLWAPADVGTVIAEAKRRGTSCTIENDVKLALVAERSARSGDRDDESMCLVWLGPAVGLASWANGGIVRGASGGAGEISYMPAGEGRLSDVVGAPGALRVAQELGLHGDDIVAVMSEAVEAGEPGGTQLLDTLATRLLQSAASIVTVLDPGLLVLGGPLGEAGGRALAARVEARLPELIPIPCAVEVSVVRGDAVLDGATLVATQHARARLLEAARLAGAPADRVDA